MSERHLQRCRGGQEYLGGVGRGKGEGRWHGGEGALAGDDIECCNAQSLPPSLGQSGSTPIAQNDVTAYLAAEYSARPFNARETNCVSRRTASMDVIPMVRPAPLFCPTCQPFREDVVPIPPLTGEASGRRVRGPWDLHGEPVSQGPLSSLNRLCHLLGLWRPSLSDL